MSEMEIIRNMLKKLKVDFDEERADCDTDAPFTIYVNHGAFSAQSTVFEFNEDGSFLSVTEEKV